MQLIIEERYARAWVLPECCALLGQYRHAGRCENGQQTQDVVEPYSLHSRSWPLTPSTTREKRHVKARSAPRHQAEGQSS